ncbi:MAG: tetratricopeptide repeat protein, partial [Candidatus Methanomethyliaceae archaeon]|nr:tetratricopeptide repeat protein [Candidatus Methanomethyliaceae archaeon]
YEYRHKDMITAISIYKSRMEEDRADSELYYKLALAYMGSYNEKDYLEKAKSYFDEALRRGFDDADIYFNIARIYRQLSSESSEVALSNYNKAIEIKPNEPDYYFSRGEFYEALNMQEYALRDYSKAIELKPNNWSYYNWRGELYLQMKEWDKAKNDYTEVRKLYSHWRTPKIELARNVQGGPYFELYFGEDTFDHEHWHPDSYFLEDCIFHAFQKEFTDVKQQFNYYGITEYNFDELASLAERLKATLNRIDTITDYKTFQEYMIDCRFIYTLIRDFDEYDIRWEAILRDLRKINIKLIELIDEALNKRNWLSVFGI